MHGQNPSMKPNVDPGVRHIGPYVNPLAYLSIGKDVKPVLQGSGGVLDANFSETSVTLQQIHVQRPLGENQQAVKVIQPASDGQEVKIIRTGIEVKDGSAQEVLLPTGLGEQLVSLTATGGGQTSEISYIENRSIQDGAGIHEVRQMKQEDGSVQALLDVQEDGEMGEVQTIMVEIPYGQELDANSIVTWLQQHQQ